MELKSVPSPSSNIFINYRRDDCAGHAGRLKDVLNRHFSGRVFMDLDTIDPGVDFVDAIEHAVGSCEVLIVMIGRDWLTATDGRRRLDNPDDFVRLEIAKALERSIRVIPVLVDGASMPRSSDLPPVLASLARRNAIELSNARWAFDVERLEQVITGVLVARGAVQIAPQSPVPARTRGIGSKAWLGLLAAIVLAVGVWALWNAGSQGRVRNGNDEQNRPLSVETVTPSDNDVALTPAPGEESSAVEVYSEGRLTMRENSLCDLDVGSESTLGADLAWRQVSRTKRFLTPQNGTELSVVGLRDFDSIRPADLSRFQYSQEEIDASKATFGAKSRRLPQGTVIAYRTNEGRYGKLRVEEYGQDLTIRWTTYPN